VRFEHIYDRDNLIAQSPLPYGDITLFLLNTIKVEIGGLWSSIESPG
jgi:hypothetical protein